MRGWAYPYVGVGLHLLFLESSLDEPGIAAQRFNC
jgi:hypothetical protein